MHCLAWLLTTADVEQLLLCPDSSDVTREEILPHVDSIVTTYNPAFLPDGSNVNDANKTNPHVCNQVYTDVKDYNQDLVDLVATCQHHTRC